LVLCPKCKETVNDRICLSRGGCYFKDNILSPDLDDLKPWAELMHAQRASGQPRHSSSRDH